MRLLLTALTLALLTTGTSADIRVLAPGFVYNSALKELAADFTKPAIRHRLGEGVIGHHALHVQVFQHYTA